MSPFEVHALSMEPCDSATSVIEARLVSPSSSDFVVCRSPPRVHADRPLELELAVIGQGAVAGAAESVASWISAHAVLEIAVDIPGQPRCQVSVPVKARPSGGCRIIRALVHPAYWANAASVTVVSLILAERPIPCDCLPATLRVGYNHAPAPAGAVLAAARVGDVEALQAAIKAGGSTEEAERVRWRVGRADPLGKGWSKKRTYNTPTPLPFASSSAAERPHCCILGRPQRPPRGPPHAPGGRRQPGRFGQCKCKQEVAMGPFKSSPVGRGLGTGRRLKVGQASGPCVAHESATSLARMTPPHAFTCVWV